MTKISNKIAYSLITLAGVFFIFFAIYSVGNWGGADSYVHYRISRYSWKYPKLFLDLWGKPVFNVLSSPFAQFGFLGLKIFNVIVALVSAFLIYDIAKIHKWKASYASILMLLFAPIYFIVIPSGLTEPLFGLLLLTAVWLFFKDRYLLSAIAISFIPFARNEGFVLIPLFLLAFSLKRQFRVIPFLLTGFLFFSLIAWGVHGNVFWVAQEFFGPGGKGIYGTGELFHFVKKIDRILGIPILLFWLIGFAYSTYAVLKKFKTLNDEHYFYILIVGGFFTFFAAHTFVWWLFDGVSLGLVRVIAGVVPLGALLAMRGLHVVLSSLEKQQYAKSGVLLASLSLVVIFPFLKFDVPIRIGPDEVLIKESCEWLIDEEIDDHLIYFYDPLIPHYLEKDPFDAEAVNEIVDDRENPENGMPVNAIVMWDAHFGPNEGRLPLDRLMNNESFKLLKKFTPEHPFKTLNDYTYEIYIFKRL